MMHFFNSRSNKGALKYKKFKYLGEIAGLSFMVNEVIEMDSKLSSDYIFQLIYDTYSKLSKSGSSKELLIKLMQVRYFKKMSTAWEHFWKGVIIKSKQALELYCFKEISYFKDAFDFASSNL